MNFFDFLESYYVQKNIEQQIMNLEQKYSPWLDSKTKASQHVIAVQRWIYQRINFFLIIAKFFIMKMGLIEQPRNAKEVIAEYNKKHNPAVPPQMVHPGPENVLEIKKKAESGTPPTPAG